MNTNRYPIDFGNEYKVQTIYTNKTGENSFGELYDYKSDAEDKHPGCEIITGYCVIKEPLGLIPESCRSWNNSIQEAVEDYEKHIAPLLEREEKMDFHCTEFSDENEPLYEVNFRVKKGWLQDYFGVDNACQLEALLDSRGEDLDTAEILKDARIDSAFSGLSITNRKEYPRKPKQIDNAAYLGKCIFVNWDKVDAMLNRWAKSYFGNHVSAEGSRDEDDFEVRLLHLTQSDYEKFAKLFDSYDFAHEYEAKHEFATEFFGATLPTSIARGVMQEALPTNELAVYGSALANYSGVYLMEYDKNQKIIYEKTATEKILSEHEKIQNQIDNQNTIFLDAFKDKSIAKWSFTELYEDYEVILSNLLASGKNFDTGWGYSTDGQTFLHIKAFGESLFVELREEIDRDDYRNYIIDVAKGDWTKEYLSDEVLDNLEDFLASRPGFTKACPFHFMKRNASLEELLNVIDALENKAHTLLRSSKNSFKKMIHEELLTRIPDEENESLAAKIADVEKSQSVCPQPKVQNSRKPNTLPEIL